MEQSAERHIAADETDREDAGSSQQRPIGVLVKAFAVIEAMADLGAPAPLREIASASGLPKGTLFRVLQTLASLGYVSQSAGTGFYHLTGKVSYLGRNARVEDLKMKVLPRMRELHARFNETVNLGVLDGIYVSYIAALEAQRALSWYVPAGTRDHYHCTALGRAIAAFLPAERRDALVAETALTARTPRTVTSQERLAAVLEEVRRTGIARDIEENDDGVVCIGAPVFLDGQVAASVSLSIPSSRYTEALGSEVGEALAALDLSFSTTG
jgi:DNA-binding IclR family transcriptional regulator